MNTEIKSLHTYLEELNEEYGGDISFIPPISEKSIREFEKLVDWNLPKILSYLLQKEANGIVIGNKRIFSLFDQSQKKTFVDSLERNNDPATSPWFKGRPHIFKDYLVVGSDLDICFCYSKKYSLDNPSVYICENANSKAGVDFDRLDLDLEGLIKTMVAEEFE